jgi:quercetin dioxygenase-like cupin family protein
VNRSLRFDSDATLESRPSALAMIASELAPETGGPPLHVHPTLDASFHILGGRLDFQIGEMRFTALAGASVLAPSGTRHTYANHGERAARMLIICTPADEAPAAGVPGAGAAGAGTAHRTDIVGPPLNEAKLRTSA